MGLRGRPGSAARRAVCSVQRAIRCRCGSVGRRRRASGRGACLRRQGPGRRRRGRQLAAQGLHPRRAARARTRRWYSSRRSARPRPRLRSTASSRLRWPCHRPLLPRALDSIDPTRSCSGRRRCGPGRRWGQLCSRRSRPHGTRPRRAAVRRRLKPCRGVRRRARGRHW